MVRWLRLAGWIAVAWPAFLGSMPAFGQVRDPHVFAPTSLGALVRCFPHIVVLRVEQVDGLEGLKIVYKKLADLQGQGSPGTVQHEVGKGEPIVLSWIEVGQKVICFHDDARAVVCLGNRWYDCMVSGDASCWNSLTYIRNLSTAYVGSPERLREHLTAILAEKEVVVPAFRWDGELLPGSRGVRPGDRIPGYRDRWQVRKEQVWRIKASLRIEAWDGDDQDGEPEHFVGWGIGGPEVVPSLVAALKHADKQVRAEAAQDLGQIGPDAVTAVEPLRRALKDQDSLVRVFAAEALLRIAPENRAVALPVLLEALRADQRTLSCAAAEAVLTLDPTAVAAAPVLVELLSRGKHRETRSMAAYALGRLGAGSTFTRPERLNAVNALARALRQDRSTRVRYWCADALLRFGPDAGPAMPALEQTLRDGDWPVAVLAADILSRFGLAVLPALGRAALEGHKDRRRSPAVEYLGDLGPSARAAVPALLKLLEHEDPRVRLDAISSLIKIDRKTAAKVAIPVLSELTQGGGEHWGRAYLCEGAVRMLIELGPEAKAARQAAVPEMIRILSTKGEPGRSMIANVLGKMGSEASGAVPALIACLDEDDQWSVCWGAIDALGSIGPAAKAALPKLKERLKDKTALKHVDVALAIWRIERQSGLPGPLVAPWQVEPDTLLELLRDNDPKLRRDAAWALGTIGPEARKAIPLLIERLRDPDDEVRRAAAWGLREIGIRATAAIPPLRLLLKDGSSLGRSQAADLLGYIGPAAEPAVPDLIEALKDADAGVRRSAAEALGLIGVQSVRVFDALRTTFQDRRVSVRIAAAVARYRLDGQAAPAVAFLISTFEKHPDMRTAEFLGSLGPAAKAAVPTLLRALWNEDRSIYLAAAEALKKIAPAAAAKAGLP